MSEQMTIVQAWVNVNEAIGHLETVQKLMAAIPGCPETAQKVDSALATSRTVYQELRMLHRKRFS
jgi:hypothetical protein